MKLKRFDDINEAKRAVDPAKKEEKKGKMEKILNHLLDEIKKKKMNRYEMITMLEDKFKDDFTDKELEKAVEKIVDDITHEPGKKKYKVDSERFKSGKENYVYYFIGDESKDPVKKDEPKSTKKEDDKEVYSDKEGVKFGSAEWFAKYKRVRPEQKKNVDNRYVRSDSEPSGKKRTPKKETKPRKPRKPRTTKKLERFDTFQK